MEQEMILSKMLENTTEIKFYILFNSSLNISINIYRPPDYLFVNFYNYLVKFPDIITRYSIDLCFYFYFKVCVDLFVSMKLSITITTLFTSS